MQNSTVHTGNFEKRKQEKAEAGVRSELLKKKSENKRKKREKIRKNSDITSDCNWYVDDRRKKKQKKASSLKVAVQRYLKTVEVALNGRHASKIARVEETTLDIIDAQVRLVQRSPRNKSFIDKMLSQVAFNK